MGIIQSNQSNEALKRSNVKLQAQQVSSFDGKAIKWRSWKKKTRAAIGTAGMLKILDDSAYAKKHTMDNETVFHMLQVATSDGSAAHLVDAHEEKKDGHQAFQDLTEWYEGDELTNETAEDVRAKLDKIFLNTKNSASEYINYFQMYTKQLDELGEAYTSSKTVSIFLDQIDDPDYESTKELCIESRLNLQQCIERIRSKERRIGRFRSREKKKVVNIRRMRENVTPQDNTIDISKHKNERGYYSLPSNIWRQLSDEDQEKLKSFNGDLRRKRKREYATAENTSTQPDAKIVQRRVPTESSQAGKDIESERQKRQRTVQFRDDREANDESPKNERDANPQSDEVETPTIQNRRDVLTFQINK